MKHSYICVFFLTCIFHFNTIHAQQQEFDVFGDTNYAWGAQLQPLLRFYTEYRMERTVLVDKANNIHEVVRTAPLRYESYYPIELLSETKTYTFHKEALVEISIIVTETDISKIAPRKKRPGKLYESVKQALSKTYKQSPPDKPVFQSAQEGFFVCQWETESTKITLARLNEIVFLQYSARQISEETKRSLNNTPDYLNLPLSSKRYLLPFLLQSTVPVP